MNKIDQIITGVNDTNNGKNIKIKIKTQTVSPKPKPKPKATHKKDRKPICPICGQKFKNFQALGGHKKKNIIQIGEEIVKLNRMILIIIFNKKIQIINVMMILIFKWMRLIKS
eukprot:988453_1